MHRDNKMIDLVPTLFSFREKPGDEVAKLYNYDSELYISFKPESEMGQDAALKAMESCVNDIRTWMIVDKLKLNDGKTEFMVIGTKQQLSKLMLNILWWANLI